MISFQNITKKYFSDIVALDNISFDVEEKEFVAIVGKSGAGKTTLLKLFLREEAVSSGKIFFKGEDIHRMKKRCIPLLRRRVGVIFQDYKLLKSKTVYENIAYALEILGADKETVKNDVSYVLDIVNLKKQANNFPDQLSGGEKQRTAIARALIHRPEVIIADEPTGNLDPYHTRDIIELLKKINEFGTIIILSTHDKEIINNLEKRVITLEQGRLVKDEKKGRFIL
ncbi:MAG: cell division ATP-binding protein FtsE [Patescibacteria group bacterium]|nr:cell division ATP-binding protein FtsE [Patescibacteria group bacterium]